MYKHPSLAHVTLGTGRSPQWSYFSTISLILYTTEKTKTAIDYLHNRQISGQAEAQKACFLFPWSTREWSLTYRHSPSNPRLFLYPYIPQPWRGICQGFYWPPEGRQEENPTSSPSPNHLPSSTEAQHCTANGKAGTASVHPCIVPYNAQTRQTEQVAQLTVVKTASQELPYIHKDVYRSKYRTTKKKSSVQIFKWGISENSAQMESFRHLILLSFLFCFLISQMNQVRIKKQATRKGIPLLAIWSPQRESESLSMKEVGVKRNR